MFKISHTAVMTDVSDWVSSIRMCLHVYSCRRDTTANGVDDAAYSRLGTLSGYGPSLLWDVWSKWVVAHRGLKGFG